MKRVRIGGGAAFSGDRVFPAVELVEKGDLHYIAFDYLAELTLAIQQKVKKKDPRRGYAPDIEWAGQEILPRCARRGLRYLTNGGGANPKAAGEKAAEILREYGIRGKKVAVVLGDDITEELDRYRAQGVSLTNLDTGEPFDRIRDRVVSANAYLGAWPMVEALAQGADVLITGRCADSALWLAPLIHEFGWRQDDWDLLAAGSTVGHLLECSCQCTGGNFSGWREVPEPWHVGYPIAEVKPSGEAIITKPPGTGGLVTVATCKEQLLYEVHDPADYRLPDVTVDLTVARLEQVGPDRVRLTGIRGRPRPEMLKALVGYHAGFLAEGYISYGWPDALEKARLADEILRHWVQEAGLKPQEMRAEFIGHSAIHGPLASHQEPEEVRVRFAARFATEREAQRFAREIVGLWVAPPAGATGILGPPSVREVIGLWPTLVPWEAVRTEIIWLES
ncbi:MAG: acyclic terpene utilization AtuA family protein [Armatimonadota bacterium]|nr:acyclic terpene utilization AtuA family protein [Armatimonadota bacterium]MDR7469488.1 acyclic terpene utilization AtuA family protein [Armatimonadota bacterium]MDR7475439.1 acyclic terpene utilization AtuA family protein [Armatimonadota bacterium]